MLSLMLIGQGPTFKHGVKMAHFRFKLPVDGHLLVWLHEVLP